MEREEAFKIFGVEQDSSIDKLKRIYLGKSEFYKKQLADLEGFPFLIKEKEKFQSDSNLLNQAFLVLGGKIDDVSDEHKQTFKEHLLNSINRINSSFDNWRDQILNSLKRIPGILFFTLLLITFIILFKIII